MSYMTPSSPHIRGKFSTRRIMLDVIIALIPALILGVVQLGERAFWVVFVSVVTTMSVEFLYSSFAHSRNTVPDASAAVTGLLFGMTLPASVSYEAVIIGAAVAIIVAKMMCGGLGQNVFNPALLGRAFIMLVYPAEVTRYVTVDGVTSATALHSMVQPNLPETSILDMFLGNCAGSIGELSALALIIGGAYLVIRKVISPRIPVAYLATVAVITLVFHKTDDALSWMLYSLLSGGLMLGAIFMATDYATSPVTAKGQVIYGIGCGILTVLFRYFGLFPEGVTYAILLMNACAWAIDRYTPPRRFGVKKGGKANA